MGSESIYSANKSTLTPFSRDEIEQAVMAHGLDYSSHGALRVAKDACLYYGDKSTGETSKWIFSRRNYSPSSLS